MICTIRGVLCNAISCNNGGPNGNRCTYTQNHGGPGALASYSPGAGLQAAAQSLANYYASLTKQATGLIGYNGNFAVPQIAPCESLPRADPIVGELVGWRVWFICEGYLRSFSAGYIWLPDEPMTGVPSDYGDAGVWAFKNKTAAFAKATNRGVTTVAGSVYMWGEVIEHEDGWRAEFAAVRSVDAIFGLPGIKSRFWRTCAEERDALNDIRERYGLITT